MSQDRLDMLDAYLDGALSGEDLARFEALLATDAELRAMVEAQRQIDASIRRTIVPREVPLPVETGIIEPPRRRLLLGPGTTRRERIRFAVAAVFLIAIGGVYYALMTAPEKARGKYQPAQVYTVLVNDGFRPREVCTDETQFRDWMLKRHGLAMVIPASLPGVELVGWTYESVMRQDYYGTSILMARVEGAPVIVLIEDRENAQRLFVPKDSGLHIFRRNLQGVALYEITPHDEPALIEHAEIRE